jgi:hypothetical protein
MWKEIAFRIVVVVVGVLPVALTAIILFVR